MSASDLMRLKGMRNEQFKSLVMLYFPTLFEKWRWHDWCPVKKKPVVFYGYEELSKRDQAIGGGIVKCQDLAGRFPNTPHLASILYLVSSALPSSVIPMVKYAKKKGLKVVLNQNGVAYPAWAKGNWEQINLPLREVLHQADYVFYQSHFCKLSADRYLGKIEIPHSILYNAVDTKFFALPLHSPDGFRVLLAGSHNQFYRVQTALQTVASLKNSIRDVKLVIAGRYLWAQNEAQALKEARNIAEEIGVDKYVEFLGAYRQKDAPSLMQGCHVLLHTQYNDSCPRLVIEAMSCGLPVAYSASGGTPELVGNAGVGIAAPLDWDEEHPPAASDLAEAIVRIWLNYSDYAKRARIRAVEAFDVGYWIQRHREIFDTLCH